MESTLLNESVIVTTLVERESAALFQTYHRLPIGTVTKTEGCVIHTENGTYLDMISGLGVNALGYSHPKILSQIQKQAASYLHLSNLYLQEPQIVLAEQLKSLSGFDRIFFCNSGTEAVEGAIKLARAFGQSKGKYEVLGLANAFHGRTYGALSLMDKPKYREAFSPFVEGMRSVAVENLEVAVNERTAAVIIEVIQGEGGIKVVSPETVAILNTLRERYGILIIADEIQSGIGRTGTFLACEQFGLKPDIVVAAKAVGGGLPLGAILANNAVALTFKPGMHGTTFGGNALSCVCGSVVLDEIKSGLMDHVTENATWFFGELHNLKSKHSAKISEIRGAGYMIGIEFSCDVEPIYNALLDAGFITNVTAGSVLRLLPPLVISKIELSNFVNALNQILST